MGNASWLWGKGNVRQPVTYTVCLIIASEANNPARRGEHI